MLYHWDCDELYSSGLAAVLLGSTMKGEEKEGSIDLDALEDELRLREQALSTDPDGLRREYEEISDRIEATQARLHCLERRRREYYERFPRVDRYRELTYIQADEGLTSEEDWERGLLWQDFDHSEREVNDLIEALTMSVHDLEKALERLKRHHSTVWLRADKLDLHLPKMVERNGDPDNGPQPDTDLILFTDEQLAELNGNLIKLTLNQCGLVRVLVERHPHPVRKSALLEEIESASGESIRKAVFKDHKDRFCKLIRYEGNGWYSLKAERPTIRDT